MFPAIYVLLPTVIFKSPHVQRNDVVLTYSVLLDQHRMRTDSTENAATNCKRAQKNKNGFWLGRLSVIIKEYCTKPSNIALDDLYRLNNRERHARIICGKSGFAVRLSHDLTHCDSPKYICVWCREQWSPRAPPWYTRYAKYMDHFRNGRMHGGPAT